MDSSDVLNPGRDAGAARPPVGRLEAAVLTLCVAAFLTALVVRAWRVGVTVDEPAHLLAAHLYWHGADRLAPGDMPPLLKIVGGWVAARFQLPIPYDHEVWKSRHEWPIAQEMMARMSAEQIRTVFFYSRLPLLIFPLACAVLLWWWGRKEFSPTTGILLAAAFMLSPTVLAHGPLFKNDLAATFGYLFFCYRSWVFWREPNTVNAAWLGTAGALGVLAKLSLLILLAIGPLLVLARHAVRRPRRVAAALAGLAVVLLIPYAASMGACALDMRRLPAAEVRALAQDPRIPAPVIAAAQVFRVVPYPAPLWRGVLSLFRTNADGTPGYLMGQTLRHGHPLYFVVALALKIPVPIQILILAGAALELAALYRRRFDPMHLFWIVPPLVYIGLASLSSFQLGVCLVLPALPLGLMTAGPAVDWLLVGRRVAVLASLFTVLGLRTAQAYPHPMGFFNLWVRDRADGIRYLADSNMDWGQNLRDLAEVVRRRGIKRIRLSYFGSDAPWAYFTERQMELIPPPWAPDLARGTVLKPEPGYWAISASLLPGHFFEPPYRDYYKAFRDMKPIDIAGSSLYVYHVD